MDSNQIDIVVADKMQDPEIEVRVHQMQAAASAGGLNTVQELMAELKDFPAGYDFLKRQGGPLDSAVRNGRIEVVKYLCSSGATINSHVFEVATRNEDQEILDTFLRNGWDINEQLSWQDPPSLS